jgi:hypothetical protein
MNHQEKEIIVKDEVMEDVDGMFDFGVPSKQVSE